MTKQIIASVSLPNRGKTSFQVITVSYLSKYRKANVLEIRRQNIFWLVLDSEL